MIHSGERPISDFLPTEGCPMPNYWAGTREYAGEIGLSVGVIDLFDIYAYLAKVSGSRDAEMPVLSPIKLTSD